MDERARGVIASIILVGLVAGCGGGSASSPPVALESGPAASPPAASAPPVSGAPASAVPTPERIVPSQPMLEALPSMGPPWEPASDEDTALVDRTCEILTAHDMARLQEVYAPDLRFVTSWGGDGDMNALVYGLEHTQNIYERASPVSVTTEAIPGLPPLGEGNRWLYSVTRIHGQLFDGVFEVNPEGIIVMQFADEYADPSIRLTQGFPAFPSASP